MKTIYRVIAKQDKKNVVYSAIEMAELPEEVFQEVSASLDKHVHLKPEPETDSIIIFSSNKDVLFNFVYGITFNTNSQTGWKKWFESDVFTFDYLG